MGPIDRRCPKCNCPRSNLVAETTFFGQVLERRACGFCHHTFRVSHKEISMPSQSAKAAAYDQEPVEVVSYQSELVHCRCPSCRSRNPPVTKTMPSKEGMVVRYHKCSQCELTFHSEERA